VLPRFLEVRDEEDARFARALLPDFFGFDRLEARRFTAFREGVVFLRDRLRDLVVSCRFALPAALFALLATVRRVLALACLTRGLLLALPATAPATPPTTAPIGPAILPTAAPATAPAVVFGIGGISMFSEDRDVSSFR
jgi:hypothetical protein